jgi:hypothetical protein
MSIPSRELRPVRLLAGAVLLAFASTSAAAQGSDPKNQPQPPQQHAATTEAGAGASRTAEG